MLASAGGRVHALQPGAFVVQNEPHLADAHALVRAALDAAGMQTTFTDAPWAMSCATCIKSPMATPMWI